MSQRLIEQYRGTVLENMHFGRICGVDAEGEVKYKVGDVNRPAYLRSAAKPIQALPVIRRGLQEKFGLTDQELTLLGASHRGEPFHVEALESLSRKLGLTEDNLICPPSYPLNPERRDELMRQHLDKRRMYHNCSGKHLGMLALCKMLDVNIDGYWEPEHPVQREIVQTLSDLSDVPLNRIMTGIDGCGVPVFALPLTNIAMAYLRLACPDLIADDNLQGAVRKLTRIMNENGEMIGGTRQICSTLLQDPNIVAKGGAKGVYCFGLKEERLAFALKVDDGTEEVCPLIVAGILQQIRYKNRNTIENILQLAGEKIINDDGRVVGESKIAFQL